MAIDFTLAPEHEEIRRRVRAFVQETIIPAVKGFDDEGTVTSRDEYLRVLFELREAGQGRGAVAAAHAKEWGGMGLGPRRAGHGAGRGGQGSASGRSCSTARRPTRATCTRCCTGRTDEQKEKYLRPLCEGTARCAASR